jgi:hypothetical protein
MDCRNKEKVILARRRRAAGNNRKDFLSVSASLRETGFLDSRRFGNV